MPLLSRDPFQRQQRLLAQFRKNFLFLTADGAYPPHRQQRLYKSCQNMGLDWDMARQYIFPEAVAFLRNVMERVVEDNVVTAEEVAQLRRLQRRLGLSEVQATPIAQLYELVERRIEAKIIERAAYLSSAPLIATLKQEIAAYELPEERTERLYRVLERQHELAKLMAGQLPVVRPEVDLYASEVCHLDQAVRYTPAEATEAATIRGRLVATSERLMLLSPSGGMLIKWPQIQTIVPTDETVTILTLPRGPMTPAARGQVQALGSGTVFCADPQYVATLLGAAMRIYTTPAPQPLYANKRLPPL